MESRPLKIRRGRRQDFASVMGLLAAAGVAVPPADRATLGRFRRVAADLGTDLYVAEAEGSVVGLIYVSYTRQLATGQRARIEQLAVQPGDDGRRVEAALLEFMAARARKRACASISCVPAVGSVEADSAARAGWHTVGTEYGLDFLDAAEDARG